ncbi:MAG: hypothetical protein ACRBF0_17945 [Calditrichia bacterium]
MISIFANKTVLQISCVFLIVLLAGCSGSSNPDDDFDGPFLNLDGEQDSAPTLTSGTWEFASRFTASDIGSYAGGSLTGVYFYLTNRPDAATVKIYGAGSANTPGGLLFSANMTASLRANRWNRFDFSSVVPLGTNDIWISLEVSLPNGGRTVGCDAGPAKANGDWLYIAADGWRTYRDRAGESVNWNLRGIVAE